MSSQIFNTRKSSIADAIQFVLEKKKHELIDSSVVGRWLYLVLKKDSNKSIISCRFFKEVNCEEWQFEWFDENNPPNVFDCPEKILSQSDNNAEIAKQWRENCSNRKKQNAAQRNSNKEKLALLSQPDALNLKFVMDEVGEVVFNGFYMQSKTQIVIRLCDTGELKKVRLSLIDTEEIRSALDQQ